MGQIPIGEGGGGVQRGKTKSLLFRPEKGWREGCLSPTGKLCPQMWVLWLRVPLK